ncbi:MAG: ABC transporter ATP-binding protein, partial [Halanaerobium sp.]
MVNKDKLKNSSINEIIEEYPYTESFFEGQKLAVDDADKNLREIFTELTVEEMEDVVFDVDQFADSLASHIRNMQEFLGENDSIVGT